MPHGQIPSTNSQLDAFAILTHVDKVVADAIQRHELEKSKDIEHFEREIESLKKEIKELEALIQSGFPNGDPLSHRKVHEEYIREAEDRKSMLRGTKHKVVELSAWALILLLANAVWDYMKNHLK